MPSSAYLDGWFTHKSGLTHPKLEGMPDNPYDPDWQPYFNQQWMSGWCDRFSAVKHGGDLVHDEAL